MNASKSLRALHHYFFLLLGSLVVSSPLFCPGLEVQFCHMTLSSMDIHAQSIVLYGYARSSG